MKDSKQDKHKLEIELNPEQKAYIYQQLNDFVPFFLPDSDMGVFVSKENTDGNRIRYAVTLVLSGGGAYVQAEALGDDIYEATSKAKTDLLEHLYEIQRKILNSEERDRDADAVENQDKIVH